MIFVAAVGINITKMRSASTAGRHGCAVVRSKRLTHTTSNSTAIALHFDVQSFTAGSDFVKVQQALAVGVRPLMHEIHPWKIIEMSMFARHHKASRNH
jgi:hypothetical protein